MINTAIIGLGWWGKTLVESLADGSDVMRFTALATRSVSADASAFAKLHRLAVADSFAAVLHDSSIDAVVLATPPSGHAEQVIAAARAGKHVFCEKPFTFLKSQADAAIEAVRQSGVTLGVGYNRRFHPEMAKLRERIRSGQLGTLQHIECIMTSPGGLTFKPTAWRAQASESPCGGLAPLGVHGIDAMIDLGGEMDRVFCQSAARAIAVETDDTTSILFRMKDGMTGYLCTIITTGAGFSLQVYGSKGWWRLEGMVHLPNASSEERRTRLFGTCKYQPTNGPLEVWEAEPLDVTRACMEAFARAASGGAAFPITLEQIVHGCSVTEAVIRSAASGQPEAVA